MNHRVALVIFAWEAREMPGPLAMDVGVRAGARVFAGWFHGGIAGADGRRRESGAWNLVCGRKPPHVGSYKNSSLRFSCEALGFNITVASASLRRVVEVQGM